MGSKAWAQAQDPLSSIKLFATNSWPAMKGTPSNDASWPENIENVQIFPSAGFVLIFCQYLCNKSSYYYEFELLSVQPCWVACDIISLAAEHIQATKILAVYTLLDHLSTTHIHTHKDTQTHTLTVLCLWHHRLAENATLMSVFSQISNINI